jgi:hypothetical protein
MRVVCAAVLLTVMLTGSALAQSASPGVKPPPVAPDPPKTYGEIETEKSQDKAYKNSLRNIPDKPPADPWGGARAIDGSSSGSSSKRN